MPYILSFTVNHEVRRPARTAEVTLAADKCPPFLRLNGPVSETFRRRDDPLIRLSQSETPETLRYTSNVAEAQSTPRGYVRAILEATDSGEREDFPPVGGALQDRLRRREPPAAQEQITLIESDRSTSAVRAAPVLATTAVHGPQQGEEAFGIVHCRMRWLWQEGCHRISSEIAPSGTIFLENAPVPGTFVGSGREILEWRSL